MQVKERLINNWKVLKEKGDVNALAKITDKDASTISRVLVGKQEASIAIIEQIIAFYKERAKQIAKINS